VMIDTHAHLDSERFGHDREEVIDRAFSSGVEAIVNVGTDVDTSLFSMELAAAYGGIYAAVGFHPHNAGDMTAEDLSRLADLASDPKVVAIGEIGLDFYRNYSPRDVQLEAFRSQVRLAVELGLPMIIHSRNVGGELLRIVEEEGGWRAGGVMHCFSGGPDMAARALELGFYIGIGGAITFRRSRLLGFLGDIPLDRIVLETDCPYVTPEPYRGRRNEPAYIRFVAEKLSQELGLPVEEVDGVTSENARRLFGI